MRGAFLLLLPSLLRSRTFLASATPELHDETDGLFSFVSRPDIKAPKWNITVFDKEALAPGYWFFGPYETLNMDDQFGNGWIGPHIYTQDGTLIWSGAPMFDNGNIEDFRLSNVEGEMLITVMDQRHSRGLIMDQHYQVLKRHKTSGPGNFNSHEYHVVENGTKALVIYGKGHAFSKSESKAVGYDGKCQVACDGLAEFDVHNWSNTFKWESCRGGGISLEESTLTAGSIQNKCSGQWDYVHANSVDKTPDGDYLLSCRHSDALYKISHKDKSIIWRFGGTKSDFEHIDGFKFSRQHNIRYRGGNETHTIISFLDNAKGIDSIEETNPFSRGLLVALDESSDPMTAKIIANYDHPMTEDRLAFRRGNYQPLDNGNVFMCWSERALQSEHAADGRILMQARLEPKWLGTYRAYKFEFVGLPKDPPDVVGDTVVVEQEGGGRTETKTEVWVSWNGATEVHSWRLFKTTARGKPRVLVDAVEKDGFENKLGYDGYAQYIIAEALAQNDTVLGQSKILKIASGNATEAAVNTEVEWQAYVKAPWYESPFLLAGMGLFIGCAALGVVFWIMSRRGLPVRPAQRVKGFMDNLTRGRYARLTGNTEKDVAAKDFDLAQNPLMGEHRRGRDDDQDAFALDDEEEEWNDVNVKEEQDRRHLA
ncbi:hypothetical protein LTR37_010889 [Vermiconidia calcicola]|uniref:Uncharacterized protein n=1 Tax=Vermiconidia calcicola TaxID=1690605 RepID=A0ACC3N3Y9_9PEZI|nr:hypothetical protein LTR37_010889 [Vermiconidia calcicola]